MTLFQYFQERVTLQYLHAAPNSYIEGLARRDVRSPEHLNTHLKTILVALLLCTLNIATVHLINGLILFETNFNGF